MKPIRAAPWMLLGLGALNLLGCASRPTAQELPPSAREPANVVLHLANESSARRTVDLEVYVDGELAVCRRVARLATATGFRDREVVPLRLALGSHTLRVVVDGRAESATAHVVATAQASYVSVEYWYEPDSPSHAPIPEKVEVRVQDRPFGFC